MENTNRYVTGLTLTAGVVVISGVLFLQGLSTTVKAVVADEVNYSMPRPRSALYNFFFGLEGREVKRQEINPFKDQEAKTSTAAGSVRKPDDKTAAAKAAAASAAAAKKAQAAQKTAQAAKKPEVKVNVVPKDSKNSISSADGANRGGSGPIAGPGYYGQGDTTTSGAPAKEVKNGGMSSSQWRSLISAQPTKENVAKLVKAFNEKEVDAATLYTIMDDLVQSSNSDTQNLGLMIAQEIPSLRSFTVISNNYEKLGAEPKKTADAYFLSYMQSSRLGILAMALQSEDADIVHRAAQVMVLGLQNAKSGTADPSSRPGRGVTVAGTSKSSQFAQFIPLFQNLERNSDSAISGLAQNALSQLQALSNT